MNIKRLSHLSEDDLYRLIAGYTSHAKYHVTRTESDAQTVISLELIPLAAPYHKDFAADLDAEAITRYLGLPAAGFSFGAYDGEQLVAIALAEPMPWNRSLWVWELHVAPGHQGRGLGRALVDALTAAARDAELRTIVCETQNTNAPAIHFYRRAGFALEGIDLSYYTNSDYPDGEIAIFMKKQLL